MVNTDDFIKRLEYLMDYYNVNASAFADKIGVQRSSISHLLSGRNKPSLDFVLKIQEFFPDVNLYWILKGTEKFLKSEQKENVVVKAAAIIAPTLFEADDIIANDEPSIQKTENIVVENVVALTTQKKEMHQSEASIFKIVIFYNDGTFKDFAQQL